MKGKLWSIAHGQTFLLKYFFMLIGELVERTGLTKDTIRFYEKKGLISLDRKSRRENNYKEYPEYVLQKLTWIRKFKQMGFTLNEIDQFMQSWKEDDASCVKLKSTLENKISLVHNQIRKLNEVQARLTASLTKCNDDNCEFEKSIPSCLCEHNKH